jgi:phage baseplate assembly protein W
MKSLALVNGDLSVGAGGYQLVTGSARIRQDMALALGEEIGNDQFHPEWGSVLIRFLGQQIDQETQFHIRSEIARVIRQYIDAQAQVILINNINRNRQTSGSADIVVGVSDITTTVSYDTIQISANLQTLSGKTIAIDRTVNL